MTDEERRDVDAACLRLLGWKTTKSGWCAPVGKWEAYPPQKDIAVFYSPSLDPRAVVPLAEALRSRGYMLQMTCVQRWHVSIRLDIDGPDCAEAIADDLPLALATAAARAVGAEP